MDINRETVYQTLMDIETKNSFSNLALNNQISRLKPDSPGFVRELTYGVLRNRILLDYYIDLLAKSGIRKIKNSDLVILRMGMYQVSCMDSVPEYAAVNECVKLARKHARGRDGFINGMLRSFIRQGKSLKLPDRKQDEIRYLSVKYSYSPQIVKLWTEQFGNDRTEEILAAGNVTPDLVIRPNSLKIEKAALAEKLREEGFEVADGIISGNALHVKGSSLLESRFYEEGLFSVQDESSQKAVETVGAEPGETVMDVCAAPGGKSLALAERMENRGRIIASDIYENKIKIVSKQAERLGVDIIETEARDASETDERYRETADRVLVDAPCSGLGVVRSKPEIKYSDGKAASELPELQIRILEASADYVKPGGVLVYSTCTINRHENEDVTDRFLRNRKDFERELQIQLLPTEGTDGFFICKFKRKD